MALKFGAQTVVSFEAMDDVLPLVLSELARNLLREARPDWDTLSITVDRDSGPFRRDKAWLVRLHCYGGRRNCQVRGG